MILDRPYPHGTIGIGASGPHAGEAVFKALRAAEKVGEGSIGGFAVYAVMKKDGKVELYKTQRGGSSTLITRGETTGVMPPEDVLEARIAAIISSGPDRPEPLERALPAKENVGIVTGHRIPIAPCRIHGKAINQEILELMEGGATADEAVEKVIGENMEADVGIIAIDKDGRVSMKNTARVERRTDVAAIKKEDEAKGAVVAVLMNEIHPVPGVAEIAAGTAIDIMTEKRKPDAEIVVRVGSKVEFGPRDEVHVDENMIAIKHVTSDKDNLKGEKVCCVPYGGAHVFQKGREIGYTITEPLTILKDGIIKDLSGQKEFRVAIKYL